MKKVKWLVIIGITASLLIGTAAVFANAGKTTVIPYVPPATATTVPLDADTIFTLVNAERTQRGLKPLVRDARLDATAQAKTDEMVQLDYFAHDNPATGKNSAWDNPIFNQICTASSENISAYHPNDKSVVSGWMGSKPHHDAIIRADYTLTGVAVSGTKVTQHFCIAN